MNVLLWIRSLLDIASRFVASILLMLFVFALMSLLTLISLGRLDVLFN